MHTPGHALINIATLGSILGHEGAILAGALLPDVPIVILYLQQRLAGVPEETIWAVHYQKRFWLAVIHGAHSIPLAVLGALLSWLAGSGAGVAFFVSVLLHSCCDLPVHAIDAHRHFLPFSQYRFQSPFSYWDPRFHARYVAAIEVLLVLASSLYIALGLSLRWPPRTRLIATLSIVAVNLGYLRSYYRSFVRR